MKELLIQEDEKEKVEKYAIAIGHVFDEGEDMLIVFKTLLVALEAAKAHMEGVIDEPNSEEHGNGPDGAIQVKE